MTLLVPSPLMSGSAALVTGTLGQYAIYDEIGVGGMAAVHIGRLTGPANFARIVAIKRLHAHLARQPEFVTMFLDEARVAARVRHPNVVATLDLVAGAAQPYLVMEYVRGESVARLQAATHERRERIPPAIACAIAAGVLHGLQAAHEATNERGELLGIVHRDVSPQNVMVGVDGVSRVLDFGVAKAAGRLQTTGESRLKGKLAYTAPELVRGEAISRAADIYSAAVVLWEMLAGERLFAGDNEANVLERVLFADVAPPGDRARGVPPSLDAVVLRGLARDPAQRFPTAREMARAIEGAIPLAGAAEVGEWAEGLARGSLLERARKVARIESGAAPPVDDGPSQGLDLSGFDAFDPRGAAGATDVEPALRVRGPAVPQRWGRRRVLVASAVLGAALLALVARRGSVAGRASGPGTGAPPRGAERERGALPALASSGPAVPSPPIEQPPPPAAAAQVPLVHRPPPVAAPGVASAPRLRPSPTPAKASCDPPWSVDAEGVKTYKLECL